MDIPRSPMDRERSRGRHPLSRALGGYLGTTVVLVGVVAAVAAIPVIFLWVFLPDEPAASIETVLEPPAPLPPRVEAVTFTSSVTPLEGVLHVPAEAGAHPAVVVVGAWTEQARADFPEIGDALARVGIVALTEAETGSAAASPASSPWSPERAMAALAFLEAQPDVRWTRLGVVDLTDGAVARAAAGRSPDVAFTVVTAPPDAPGSDVAESDLTAVNVPTLWILSDRTPGDHAETVALLDALRASGKPFAYHVSRDADQREGTGLEQPTDVGAVIDAWMRETGLR